MDVYGCQIPWKWAEEQAALSLAKAGSYTGRVNLWQMGGQGCLEIMVKRRQ